MTNLTPPTSDPMGDDSKMSSRAVLVIILVGLALLLGGFSTFIVVQANHERSVDAQRLARELLQERDERVNQDCVIFEGNQKADIDTLQRTYEYLADLSPAQLREPLNRVILDGLSGAEREAKLDDAPDYCDEPRVGLPEPDPKMPIRPRALSDLLADD